MLGLNLNIRPVTDPMVSDGADEGKGYWSPYRSKPWHDMVLTIRIA